MTIEVASVIELSEASGQVAAQRQNPITLEYQIYPPTIDTIVTGMTRTASDTGAE